MVDRLQASTVTENSISEGRHRSDKMYDDDDDDDDDDDVE
jgi:hypothetical protein